MDFQVLYYGTHLKLQYLQQKLHYHRQLFLNANYILIENTIIYISILYSIMQNIFVITNTLHIVILQHSIFCLRIKITV